ncbi:hypothetical protein JHK87_040301 [Glycine soja]|nr:hypothetical protein JHK87_040301 [Glycine soja]
MLKELVLDTLMEFVKVANGGTFHSSLYHKLLHISPDFTRPSNSCQSCANIYLARPVQRSSCHHISAAKGPQSSDLKLPWLEVWFCNALSLPSLLNTSENRDVRKEIDSAYSKR